MSPKRFALAMERDAAGNMVEVTAPAVYLDVSDLSYLVLGRLGGSDRPIKWRERFRSLLEADRARLRISMVHVTEMALRADLTAAALEMLESLPAVYFATTTPLEIFDHERAHAGAEPLMFVERRLSRSDLESVRIPLRVGAVSGTTVARFVKGMFRMKAGAESLQRRAALRSAARVTPEQQRAEDARVRQILRGDTTGLPRWVGVATRGLHRASRALGVSPDMLDRHRKLEPRGLGWAATTSAAHVQRLDGKRWNREDVVAMPATVLRACIERAYRDPTRPPDASTDFDAGHIAYAAYSDVSTVDKRNHDAIKAVTPLLPHLRIFRTGDLEPVLRVLESESVSG